MTVNHPLSGRPDRPRRLGARAVALVVALLLTVAPLVAPGAAGAEATPTPTPPAPTGETTFTLSPVGSGVVRDGDKLTVSITMQNGTDAAVPATPVELALGRTALPSRAALTTWLSGDITGVSTAVVEDAILDPVPAGESETSGVAVDADDKALANLDPGVYPLLATYESAAGEGLSTSVMIVPDDEAPATGLGIIVPITAPAIETGLLSAEELTELTGPTGALTNSLNAVEGTPAILAIDPAIAAAIRVLGSAAPDTATEWLDRLLSLPNARFALQYGDADVATQLQAGLAEPAQPTSLQPFMAAENFVPDTEIDDDLATPSPTPTTADADPDAVTYPELASLLDIGGGRDGVFWPSASAITPEVITQLGAIGVDERSGLTLVPSSSTNRGAAGATVTASATAGDADLLVYDTDISAALRDASQIDDFSLRAAPLTAATAYLAFATAEADGAPLLVTLDRAADRTRVGLRTAITSGLAAPGVTTESLSTITTSSAKKVSITGTEPADASPQQQRVDAASALFEGETELRQFATILDDPNLITGRERAEILQLLSVSWQSTVGGDDAVTAHRDQTAATLASVGIIPPTSIQLLTADADLPVFVHNDLPYPVNLVLYATPDDLRLDVQAQTTITAQPASNTSIKVPVQARVGSGEVTVRLDLRSPTYQPIGGTQYAEVTVRADWEGIGVVILAVVIGGLLAVGVIRTLLRRRQNSEPEQADESTDSADGAQ